ncbi:Proline-rich P65 protein [Camponotus floridanus]|uniref:Proline-rich P65 protein n=1 Tax=Camponotus floridanus TaxID=104421 RepID=E2AC33_CAMFO|nr:Proline-rich P65 protein [Camponotus floridanus]
MAPRASSSYGGVKPVKASPLEVKKLERKEKKNSASPVRLEVVESNMEVEPLVSDSPGCSKDREYMDRDTEWPGGAASIPWTKEEDKHRKEEITSAKTKNRRNLNPNMYSEHNIYSDPNMYSDPNAYSDTNMYNDNANFSHKSKLKSNLKNYVKKAHNIYSDPNMYSDPNAYSDTNMYNDNANFSTKSKLKSNLKNYVKKVDKTIPATQSTPRSKGIRLVENIQIVPPVLPPPTGDTEWNRVAGRGRRMTDNRSGFNARSRVADKRETAKPGKRFLKPAVVTITSKPDGLTYAQILAKAREKVCLRDLGIQTTVIRRAISGAIVIEVPGPQGKQLASVLRSNLAEVLGQDARVQNPVTMGELRIRGIDPSTTEEEIYLEMESLSGAHRNEFKVSTISNMRDGMGVAWVTCPLQTAVKIAENGVMTLGWTRVRVELLKKRPIQCHKCWRFGHVASRCAAEIDRKGTCFRCGQVGHLAGACNTGVLRCLICAEDGKEHRHRIGTQRCLENHGYPSGVVSLKKRVPSKARIGSQSSNP